MDLSLLWTVIKAILVVVLTVNFASIAWSKRETWITAYTTIDWRILLLDLIVVVVMITVSLFLLTASPDLMGFSWLRFFGTAGTNINVIGMEIPYFGIVFVLLLMLALPWLAQIEEEMYRLGTRSWPDGIGRSISFGLTHMIVGVPFGVAIALIFVGMFLTAMYFKGGVKLSTKVHFHYNLILVSILMLVAVAHTLLGR